MQRHTIYCSDKICIYLHLASIHRLPFIFNKYKVSSFSPLPSHPHQHIPPYMPKILMPSNNLTCVMDTALKLLSVVLQGLNYYE